MSTIKFSSDPVNTVTADMLFVFFNNWGFYLPASQCLNHFKVSKTAANKAVKKAREANIPSFQQKTKETLDEVRLSIESEVIALVAEANEIVNETIAKESLIVE